jgi:hypothetical protein
MICFSCKTAPAVEGGNYCEPCNRESVAFRDALEKKFREVECPSCDAKAGEPCLSGSGVERGCAHRTREKLAARRGKVEKRHV